MGKNWDERNWNWKETIYKFREIGFTVDDLLSLDVSVDLRNNSRYVLEVGKYKL